MLLIYLLNSLVDDILGGLNWGSRVDLLIEEGLEDNDLVAGLDEAHEGREHTLICAGCDGDLLFRIQRTAEEGRVGIGEGFLQTRSSLGGRVLITFDSVQGTFRSVNHELRRIVAEEALTHVDNGLDGRGCGGLVDDGPGMPVSLA